MIKRSPNIIALMMIFILGIAFSARAVLSGTGQCMGQSCCCLMDNAVHGGQARFDGQSTAACTGRAPCCQFKENRPWPDAAMATTIASGYRPPMAQPVFSDGTTRHHWPVSPAFRQIRRWPPGSVTPIYYQTLSILC